MSTIYVQFADSTAKAIIAVFGCPQDATVYPNQGEIGSSDSRWVTYYNAQPSFAQQGIPAPV